MKQKNYIYLAIVVILAIVIISLIVGIPQREQKQKLRATTLIFNLEDDYLGNYIGSFYNRSDDYGAHYFLNLFDYCETKITTNWVCIASIENEITGSEECHCKLGPNLSKEECHDTEEEICFEMDSDEILNQGGVKRLQNNYYAAIYPASEEMVKRLVVFDRSLETKLIGRSTIILSQEEFNNYVIDENPLSEAYFCDELQDNLDSVAKDLYQDKIPVTCKEII